MCAVRVRGRAEQDASLPAPAVELLAPSLLVARAGPTRGEWNVEAVGPGRDTDTDTTQLELEFEFDNRSSLMRSKTVHFSAYLTRASTQ